YPERTCPEFHRRSRSVGGLIVWLVDWLVENLKFPSVQTVQVSPSSQTISPDRQRSHSPQPTYLKLVMSQKRKRSVAIVEKILGCYLSRIFDKISSNQII
ncbi:MAG: hypothetical protein UR23_C0026G0006, partial [Candidatus Roizmanbacteria bacterium GW2011_GWA2_32_13]